MNNTPFSIPKSPLMSSSGDGREFSSWPNMTYSDWMIFVNIDFFYRVPGECLILPSQLAMKSWQYTCGTIVDHCYLRSFIFILDFQHLAECTLWWSNPLQWATERMRRQSPVCRDLVWQWDVLIMYNTWNIFTCSQYSHYSIRNDETRRRFSSMYKRRIS